MPIRAYLEGHRFDAETTRLMGVAFEMALVALQHTEGASSTRPGTRSQKRSSSLRKLVSGTQTAFATLRCRLYGR